MVCSVNAYPPLVQRTLHSECNPEPLHSPTVLDHLQTADLYVFVDPYRSGVTSISKYVYCSSIHLVELPCSVARLLRLGRHHCLVMILTMQLLRLFVFEDLVLPLVLDDSLSSFRVPHAPFL